MEYRRSHPEIPNRRCAHRKARWPRVSSEPRGSTRRFVGGVGAAKRVVALRRTRLVRRAIGLARNGRHGKGPEFTPAECSEHRSVDLRRPYALLKLPPTEVAALEAAKPGR